MRHSIMYCIHLVSAPLAATSLGIMAVACTGGGGVATSSSNEPTISVVTTLYPLEYFARGVGGARVTVVNLVAPGVEAHSFDPTPADIRKLDEADVVLYNGSGFEPWMDRALAAISNRDRTVIQAGPRGEAEDGGQGNSGLDPHIWLDPQLAMNQVRLIRSGLVQGDPDGAAVYDANAAMVLAELETLHSRFATGLDSCSRNQFVTPHAAFGHLADRYGLEQIAITGLSPEAEPGARDLASIAETIRELGVEHIMVEPVISAAFAETLAREVGAELLRLHPLESLTPDESRGGEDYFSIMNANLSNLRRALECSE
jgi:zinc transport system substrate-binding protein